MIDEKNIFQRKISKKLFFLFFSQKCILNYLRGDQYQVVQKCSSMSYISLTPQKKIFDFLQEEVT